MSSGRLLPILLIGAGLGCQVEPPPAEAPVIHVRFDPKAGVIPKPNDILRDPVRGVLDLPDYPAALADKTPAEAALIRALEGRDGWPKHMEAEVALSGPIDPATLDADRVRVFQARPEGLLPIAGARVRGEPAEAPTRILIAPAGAGWLRGGTVVIAVLGGEHGLRGKAAEPVVADAAFWFLRLETSLTEHASAIPGATAAERLESAEKLEQIRLQLAPHFAQLEKAGVARKDVAALWAFTTSQQVEIVMDKAAGKMPIPSDFLRDPATGLVALPAQADDTPLYTDIKSQLNRYDGFALSANLSFELDDPIDPATLAGDNIQLYALPAGEAPRRVPLRARARIRDTAVSLELGEQPLSPATDHVLVVTKAVRDPNGRPVTTMLPGILAMLDAPLFDGHAPLLGSLDGETAAKVEFVRARTVAGLDAIAASLPREQIAAAWSFRTLSIAGPMRAARDAAEVAQIPPDPMDVESLTPAAAALDFPLGAVTLLRVERVYNGQILVPDGLDPLSRERRTDDRYEPRKVSFTMTVPRGHDPGEPLPVVIFGHGLMTERRFVLAIADALAGEGMAAIAIDLPFHGERTSCVWNGPQCLINPLDTAGPPICPNPCQLGSSCSPDGRCVDSNGEGNALSMWPIVGFPQASGGAFVDIDDMPGSRDHFYQAITDLSALERSLHEGDWANVIGSPIAPELRYVGQSLGGVLGAVFAAVHPELERVVLNVPGADVIDLFRTSAVFAPHLDAFLAREQIEKGSEEHERVLNIGRWILDPIDPASFAPFLLRENFDGGPLGPRTMLLQMATLDVVIPNDNTKVLEQLSGIRREDYIAEHGFIVLPLEPAYGRGIRDVARLLGEGVMP